MDPTIAAEAILTLLRQADTIRWVDVLVFLIIPTTPTIRVTPTIQGTQTIQVTLTTPTIPTRPTIPTTLTTPTIRTSPTIRVSILIRMNTPIPTINNIHHLSPLRQIEQCFRLLIPNRTINNNRAPRRAARVRRDPRVLQGHPPTLTEDIYLPEDRHRPPVPPEVLILHRDRRRRLPEDRSDRLDLVPGPWRDRLRLLRRPVPVR